MTLTMTQGTSAMQANPKFSCIKENPGPLVAVMDLTPASEAPITAPREAISSSIWMNVPPTVGQPVGHDLADLRGRGDGVAGKKPAARGQRPFHHRLVALEQFCTALVEFFSQRQCSR